MHVEEKKKEIVMRTANLVSSTEGREITTRRIAENAGINPAMVNYYFGSKGNLLKLVMSAMTRDHISDAPLSPEISRKTLFDQLVGICETSMQYARFGISRDTETFSRDVLEYSRKIVEMKKRLSRKTNDVEDKISIFRTLCFLMMISEDPEGFASYSGIDVRDKSQLRVLVSEQLDILLGEAL
ncbi:MAG: TetR/AcrR family transcriptional regulator [Candidatus Methanoplasma sp.]|nr:TetR/AcrR family transcriptional regulator [Candidatus Methanoplasma sp.]